MAEERDGDPVAFQQLKAVARAGRLEDARAHDPAGSHEADFRREQVHAAATAAGAARLSAVEFSDQLARVQSLGKGMAVAAVRAEYHVVLPQVGADTDGD